jgi:hypothetical protein
MFSNTGSDPLITSLRRGPVDPGFRPQLVSEDSQRGQQLDPLAARNIHYLTWQATVQRRQVAAASSSTKVLLRDCDRHQHCQGRPSKHGLAEEVIGHVGRCRPIDRSSATGGVSCVPA